jgi:nicotinamide-nucleotide amidase
MLPTDRDLEELARSVGRALRARDWRLATAESCTGGWIAKALTDVAGSSQWFDGGVVSYSNDAKQRLLGVPGDVLQAHGAVSEPVARAMASGARAATGAAVAVAVSGIAGPGGGTPDKPVGTVWFAWALPGGTSAERLELRGDRQAVRRASVAYALERLLVMLSAGAGV